MKNFLLFVFLLTTSSLVHAQAHRGFKWMGPDLHFYEVNPSTQELSQNSPIGVQKVLGVLRPAGIFSELPKDFDVSVFYKGDSITVSIPGTGQVYRVHPATLSVTRLDKTFFRGYNFTASQFMHQDTLFSVGGEGFWLRHSLVTYYNTRTHEWDLYHTNSPNEQPSSSRFSGYSETHKSFFSAYLDPGKDPYEKEINAYFFDFETRSWQNKGTLNPDLITFSKQLFRSVWTGTYLICFYGSNDLLIVDPFKNQLLTYKKHTGKFFLNNAQVYYQNGYLYSLEFNNTQIGNAYLLDSISVAKLVKESSLVGPVYLSSFERHSKTIYLAVAVFILAIGVFIYTIKRRAAVKVLTEQEQQLVTEFIQLAPGQSISSIDLNTILALNDKSYDNQRQIRNRIIGSINSKLQPLIQGKELILRVSSEEDKRMMNYYLNPEIKPKDLEKLR